MKSIFPPTTLDAVNARLIDCRQCPRLVRWREAAARKPPKRYAGQTYWARPVASFGDPKGRLLVIGLAPAAHGGNRTGRMFTGDRSGDWLYGALHDAGFANQSNSDHRNDGLKLTDSYISAAVHCAPPDNKPSKVEFQRCRPYLAQELEAMQGQLRVVIALGKIAFDSFLAACGDIGETVPRPRPKFGHGNVHSLPSGLKLLCSYHPSQQNTFTGKLTKEMFQSVFDNARRLIGS